jgi:tRNA(Ile)-lysidine synthase
LDDLSLRNKKKKWNGFEHFLWRELQQIPFLQRSFDVESAAKDQMPHLLLALSGGLDSIALLNGLLAIQASARIKISAMYVHHGDSADNEINSYRNICEFYCRKYCSENNVQFQVSERSPKILKSEEDFRDFRYQQLFSYQKQIGANVLITAHHRDDLLETRMLRLIRGAGADGFLGMKTWQNLNLNENQLSFLWRPLLKICKQELVDYLNERAVEYIKDPSNSASDYLRNWLRNEWLPQLEQKATGSVNSLARSLEIIAEILQQQQQHQQHQWRPDAIGLAFQIKKNNEISEKKGSVSEKLTLNRVDLLALSLIERQQLVVKLLKGANVKKISFGQVNEILKQLDNPQKIHRFTVAQCVWVVDAEQISIELK